eukprot:9341291-Lingulodinium_polyedra.AAC.1
MAVGRLAAWRAVADMPQAPRPGVEVLQAGLAHMPADLPAQRVDKPVGLDAVRDKCPPVAALQAAF